MDPPRDELELGYLLAVSAALVWSPRPLVSWLKALGTAPAIVEHARLQSPAPPVGAEPLSADALERLRMIDDGVAHQTLGRARSSGCAVLLECSSDYPARLRDLPDPPPVLYCRGDLETLAARTVAIVGSRAASTYGRTQAAAMAGEFGAYGATVVSGFARGIDAAAHRGALEAQTPTAAVFGSGVNALYPDYHVQLAEEIVASGGAVISEFPPDLAARPHHFPMRNRIVAALADATIVIEAKQRSGALITARLADELGRHVFALPGDVDRPTSMGTNALIKDGVALVTSAADVADLLGWASPIATATADESGDNDTVRLLKSGVGEPAEIALQLGTSVGDVVAQLSILEIQGVVERRAGGLFAIRGARTREHSHGVGGGDSQQPQGRG